MEKRKRDLTDEELIEERKFGRPLTDEERRFGERMSDFSGMHVIKKPEKDTKK